MVALTGGLHALDDAVDSSMSTQQVKAASSATPSTAAGWLYGVQTRPPVHEMVNGTVQPELVNAVKARTRPRTTLYFQRDMNHSIP